MMNGEMQRRRPAVYTNMMRDYARAVDAVLRRQGELRQQLRAVRTERPAGRDNRRRQQELIRRILLLREEYEELLDAMRKIRGYAAQEEAS